MYFLVPFFHVWTVYSWGCHAIKIPYLPTPVQRVLDAVLVPRAVWYLAKLALPEAVQPIATGSDIWLTYLAVTALFDISLLPLLLQAATQAEAAILAQRHLHQTQGARWTAPTTPPAFFAAVHTVREASLALYPRVLSVISPL